jgi:D-glycero-alpha-D-manno-heptose 1-phosphate guanylyltransferase
MEAIILAGGLGSRLKKQVSEVPKPLAKVDGEPFLNYIFKYLKAYGCKKVILSVCHMHELIQKHYGNEFLGIEIDYAIEKEALGTGGAIKFSLEKAKSKNVFVLNGDSFFDLNLNEFLELHSEKNSSFSLALRKKHKIERFGAVKINAENRITEFAEKGKYQGSGLINGGVYLINRDKFLKLKFPKKFSLEYDFLQTHVKKENIYGFRFDGYFIDIGIPFSYYLAQNEFRNFKYK